jgi:hypothetical protein
MTAEILIADLPERWVEDRHEVAQRDGHALRSGPDRTIEVQSIATGDWHPLQLPNNAKRFALEIERNAVLHALQKGPRP